MLEILCFDLQLESPYRILWEYSLFFNVQDHRPLRHAAYAFLNDSTYTVLCLQFPPRVIAAAALYAAARHCNVAFPDDDDGRPWWTQIDVRVDDLIRACKLIVQIYERVHQNLSKGYPDFAISDPIPEDPTRLSHDPTTPTTAPSAEALNGRKRSREPESFSGTLPSRIPEPHHRNGERSPKRQRTISPGTGQETKPSSGEHPQPRIPKKALESTASSKYPSNATSAPAEDDTAVEEGEVVSDERTPSRPAAAVQPADLGRLDPGEGAVDDEGGGGSEEGEI
jgi:protein BUR2